MFSNKYRATKFKDAFSLRTQPILMKNYLASSLWLFLLCAIHVHSAIQDKSLFVQKINTSTGFYGTSIASIVQDKHGFIWIANESALHRFDGANTKVYRYSPHDKEGIPHNDHITLWVDDDNFLWISSMDGISRLDIAHETFEVMTSTKLRRKPHFSQPSNGQLWYINDRHPLYYDKKEGKLKKIDLYQAFIRDGRKKPLITTYELISDDRMLIVEFKKSCLFYDVKKDKLYDDIPELLNKVCSGSTQLRHHNHSIFLRAKDNYLYEYNIVEDTLKKHMHLPSNILLKDLLVDKQGNTWIGTNSFLYKIPANSSTIYKLKAHDGDSNSLFNIGNLFEDNQGLIWIASNGSNSIHIYNPNVEKFAQGRGHAQEDLSLANKQIEYVFEDKNKNIWISSSGKLIHIDHSTGHIHDTPLVDKDRQVIHFEVINDIEQGENNSLWLSTNLGIYQYIHQDGFSHVQPLKTDNPDLVSVGTTLSITKDSNHMLWIGSRKKGMFSVNPKTGETTHFASDLNNNKTIQFPIVYDILIDKQSRVWAGTIIGISRLEKMTDQDFINYNVTLGKSGSLCGRVIKQILEDTLGQIWMATNNGLAKYSEEKDNFTCYGEKDGILSNVIQSIFEDKVKGSLWLGTNKGLSEISKSGELINNYTDTDGLFGQPILKSGLFDHQNTLWLGTNNGVNRIDIASERAINKPNIAITSLSINNIIQKSIDPNLLSNLELVHNQNSLRIHFSNLDYTKIKKHKYKVKLENWDKQWNHLGSASQVHYSNLPAGNYTLRIALSDAPNTSYEKTIYIHIAPPFWLTSPAYIFYTLLIIFTIAFIIKMRTRHLVQRSLHLESIVNERVSEVTEQKKTIEYLLKRKEQLFANLSHEFRTPLTLIIGPISKLINETKSKPLQSALAPSLANAKRLSRIVDQLLDLARLDSDHQVHYELINITPTIEHVIAYFDSIVKERNIRFITHIDVVAGVRISPDALEKILTNLISNAIKYTPEGEEIEISAHIERPDLVITICDTGIGIAPENHIKIFERFSRIDTQSGAAIPGAGIGLALVKLLVESAHGTISVSSTIGKGATFKVRFPYTKIEESSVLPIQNYKQTTVQEIDILTIDNDIHSSDKNNPHPSPTFDNEKPTALIIEDHPEMRKFIGDTLSEQFHCMAAQDGAIGINLATQDIPDIIITDLSMPKKNGLEVAEIVRHDTRTSHIPIIMLTAHADITTRKNAWKSDIDEYLEKPFDAEELVIRAQNILNIRHILSQRLRNEINTPQSTSLSSLNEKDQTFLIKLKTFIEENFTDPTLSAKVISNRLAMSESQLQRKIKALIGQSIPEYIRSFRLNKGAEYLKQGRRVSEIAYDVGFSNSSYFSSCFKAHYGMTATQYSKTGHTNEREKQLDTTP